MSTPRTTKKGSMPPRIAGVSDRGFVRKENQDAWLADAGLPFVVVADGMGGGPAGALAAQTVVSRMDELLREKLDTGKTTPSRSRRLEARLLLQETILSVSRELLDMGRDDLTLRGMGSTVVAAWRCGGALHVAHQGDSRAYLFRDGQLRVLTADHSIIALLLRNGEITEEEALEHPARGQLSRCVGMQGDVYCDVQTVSIKTGDRLLLCTDGLWGVVSDAEIEAVFRMCVQPDDVCRLLVELSLWRGAPDNVTAVVWNLDKCSVEVQNRV